MKLYLSGPMRGYPEFNFPAFRLAAERLRKLGHEVLNPVERDEANGFDGKGLCGFEDLPGLGFNLKEALYLDLELVLFVAEGVVVLDGWNQSKGALAEVATARAIGKPVMYLDPDYLLREVK